MFRMISPDRSVSRRSLVPLCLVVAAGLFATHAHAVVIDLVPVGDVGNANDNSTGDLYGGVSYE